MGLKVYHRGSPIPLSDRVPMLENFGFRVIDEDTSTVTPAHGTETYVHDMLLEADGAVDLAGRVLSEKIENAILAVWRREAESDALNALTTLRGLSWDDVEVLRALTRYLKQVGIPYSRDYLNAVLARHGDVAVALVTLSLVPAFLGLGWVYLLCAAGGGAWLMQTSWRLVRAPGPKTAMVAFHASLLQLTLVLAGALLDGTIL